MIVVSVFDGCGMAYQALKNLNIKPTKYYAFEIDKYAIKIALKNHPDIIQLGDITKLSLNDNFFKELYNEKLNKFNVDLVIGGSPCQDLSIAKMNRKGLLGDKSKLFYSFKTLLQILKPKYFVLENVNSMNKESKNKISELINTEPIMINSSLLTAQNRKRLYWTNIENVTQPEDMNIILQDILEEGKVDRLKSYCIDANYYKGGNLRQYKKKKRRQLVFLGGIISKRKKWLDNGKELSRNYSQGNRVWSPEGLAATLSSQGGELGGNTGLYYTKEGVRKLTPIECERLQSLPDNYTEGVSNTQRYKMLGNGFTVPVIEHILSFM